MFVIVVVGGAGFLGWGGCAEAADGVALAGAGADGLAGEGLQSPW